MLPITLPEARMFNEQTETFIRVPAVTLKLEHSLISIAKWESKWQKSYLSSNGLTSEEFMDYIRCMSLDPNIDRETLLRLTKNDLAIIIAYIKAPMTATTFSKLSNEPRNHDIITAEIVYYWMVSFGIPFECEKWHINRLLTLIEVCSRKQNPQKMSNMEAARMRYAMNEARKKKFGTKG